MSSPPGKSNPSHSHTLAQDPGRRASRCPVRSGSARSWFFALPLLPFLARASLCANNMYNRRRRRGAPTKLAPLQTIPGMRNFLIPAGLRDAPSLLHYISTKPYSRQPPSATGHDLISVTPTREIPTREDPTRENRPKHVYGNRGLAPRPPTPGYKGSKQDRHPWMVE